ncbi:MAG TPA: signal recognition particle protein, partial [Firmicutes bacterium]|nr:signal recognition particle protein [Bacillota bacterium]
DKGYKVLLTPVDVYRPAAIEQLRILCNNNGLDFFFDDIRKPVKIVQKMEDHAKEHKYEICLVDTAGRLHIDKELIDELKALKGKLPSFQTYLVLDAMTGQEAINIAGEFNTQVGFDGVILTKMDGDARGGAALSVFYTTEKPVIFLGTGEGIDSLELFYPERMSSRILGMGDVLSLIEKAKESIDEQKAEELASHIMKDELNFNDYLTQIQEMRKMGSVEQLLEMLPGFSAMKKQLKGQIPSEKDVKKMEAIIQSMTIKERTNPSILNAGRRKRIADGSGTDITDVNKLIKNFEQSKKMLKQFKKMGKKGYKGFKGLPF